MSKKSKDLMALIDELSSSLNTFSDIDFESEKVTNEMPAEKHALAIQFYFIRKFKRSVAQFVKDEVAK